jgi:hypothetical protein
MVISIKIIQQFVDEGPETGFSPNLRDATNYFRKKPGFFLLLSSFFLQFASIVAE